MVQILSTLSPLPFIPSRTSVQNADKRDCSVFKFFKNIFGVHQFDYDIPRCSLLCYLHCFGFTEIPKCGFFFFTSFRNCTIISSNIATTLFSFLLVGFQSPVVRSSGLVHMSYTLCYPFFFSFLKFFVHFRFFWGGVVCVFFCGGDVFACGGFILVTFC